MYYKIGCHTFHETSYKRRTLLRKQKYWDMLRAHIPLIMEIIENMVSRDERKRKYSNRQIMKILVLLNIFGISYRSAGIFLWNHEEYLNMIDLKEIPSFQTLSRRVRSFDLHALNRKITCEHSMNECDAMDSFMIRTCKYSTAVRRKLWRNYKDHESGWSKTTKGLSHERKCHVSMDVDSCIIREWIVTRGNIHDSRISHDRIDSVRNYSYILADSAYDTSEIYDYIFDNTHSMPVIDTNRRRGIRSDGLPMNRNIGIDLRKEYSSLYSLRWEI